jgi:hypothetical protein
MPPPMMFIFLVAIKGVLGASWQALGTKTMREIRHGADLNTTAVYRRPGMIALFF